MFIGTPASTPMDGVARHVGRWMLMSHGWLTTGSTAASGPRGSSGSFTTNMVSLRADTPVGDGQLSLRLMASLEPTMGPRGYPLLLQTGETSDGITPLIDRQHPHDFVDEVAVAYRRTLSPDFTIMGYAAAVGAPPLGPVPYFHRASGSILPEAPIGHHLHDATHVTYGVLTGGFTANRRLTFEASAFNGREPDQRRWTPDPIRLDSYALRATVDLSPNWTLQGSMARLAQPERLHPTIDVSRLSANVTYNRPLASGNWQTTFAAGRALTDRKLIPLSKARRIFPAPILAHFLAIAPPPDIPEDSILLVIRGKRLTALLLESQLSIGRSTIAARVERVAKDELFAPTDLRHSKVYGIMKGTIGAERALLRTGSVEWGVGGSASVYALPAAIRPGLRRFADVGAALCDRTIARPQMS